MFFEQLKKICDSRNIKMTPLIVECGGSKSNVTTWKNGATPNIDIVIAIAKKLNVSLDYLLTGEDNSVKELDPNFYRTLLSDNGVEAIKRQLKILFDGSEDDLCEGLEDYGISLSMMRQFFYEDISIGHDVLSKLDTVLLYLDTNVYDLIKKDILDKFKDFTSLYNALDTEDRAEIRGEMKAMLRQDKYKSNGASVINDIAEEMKPTFKKASVES